MASSQKDTMRVFLISRSTYLIGSHRSVTAMQRLASVPRTGRPPAENTGACYGEVVVLVFVPSPSWQMIVILFMRRCNKGTVSAPPALNDNNKYNAPTMQHGHTVRIATTTHTHARTHAPFSLCARQLLLSRACHGKRITAAFQETRRARKLSAPPNPWGSTTVAT